MQYRCLRDCYVNDRFWRQGETYELPDDMRKSEKNFQPLEEQPVEVEPASKPKPKPKPKVSKPEPAKEPAAEGVGDYLCPQCKVTHRAGSKVHKRHLKLLNKPA